MNLILLYKEDFIDSGYKIRLTGRRMHHILSIHSSKIGDSSKVGLAGGNIGTGKITDISENHIDMDVNLDTPPPAPLPLTLLLALPRPKTLRKVLQCITAMGVKRIILFRTWRVEKSYFTSPILSENQLKEHLILGLEQGCDTVFPVVEIRKLFKPFVEDEIPEIAKGTCAFLAEPSAKKPCPCNLNSPVTLAIGPEGGFIQYEIDALVEKGFEPVRLGARPIRVEDATAALIGRLFLH